jgi:hypothetical protein
LKSNSSNSPSELEHGEKKLLRVVDIGVTDLGVGGDGLAESCNEKGVSGEDDMDVVALAMAAGSFLMEDCEFDRECGGESGKDMSNIWGGEMKTPKAKSYGKRKSGNERRGRKGSTSVQWVLSGFELRVDAATGETRSAFRRWLCGQAV